jgi:hypothetical protein
MNNVKSVPGIVPKAVLKHGVQNVKEIVARPLGGRRGGGTLALQNKLSLTGSGITVAHGML